MLCFLLFERRVGLRIGLSLWSVSLALTVAGLLRDAGADALTNTAMVSLGRVHAFLAAVLAIVAGAAALREQLNRALERADLLTTQALTDPLTGLANRYAGNSRLEVERADAVRRGRLQSVALFDLDHSKRINDSHGHVVGERRPGGLVVTATFGVATLTVDEPLRDLLQRADVALYEGKSAGRDRVVAAEQQQAR